MRILIAFATFLASMALASGHDSTKVRFVDNNDMELQMRGSIRVEMPHGTRPSARFRMDNFRWNITGKAAKNLTYRFRQSFNVNTDLNLFENLLASVNYAYVSWHPFEEVSFTFGKNVFALGGHEFWAAPVNVIEFSDFGGTLSAYQMGINATWHITERQELVFQMANIRGTGDDRRYYGGLPEEVAPTPAPFLYTANWNGTFLDDNALELRYSASYGTQAQGKNISIFTLGQSYRRKFWGAYIDLAYSRQGLDANGILSQAASFPDGMRRTMQNVEYFSAIAYLHLYINKSFGIFLKGVGESGGLYKADGKADTGVYRYNWNTQACLEYMPTKDRDFRLFAHYSHYSGNATEKGRLLGIADVNRNTVSAGIIYIMKIF